MSLLLLEVLSVVVSPRTYPSRTMIILFSQSICFHCRATASFGRQPLNARNDMKFT